MMCSPYALGFESTDVGVSMMDDYYHVIGDAAKGLPQGIKRRGWHFLLGFPSRPSPGQAKPPGLRGNPYLRLANAFGDAKRQTAKARRSRRESLL
jgi:hypothetical protein